MTLLNKRAYEDIFAQNFKGLTNNLEHFLDHREDSRSRAPGQGEDKKRCQRKLETGSRQNTGKGLLLMGNEHGFNGNT